MEIEKAVQKIQETKAKRVLIQLPDGLKPKAKEIVDRIKEVLKDIQVDIWSGSCYGSCDTPDAKNYDLLIQWGHSEWT